MHNYMLLVVKGRDQKHVSMEVQRLAVAAAFQKKQVEMGKGK